ncbi:hypothetical protein B0H13DRAFT_1894215 [Mycena leptocephala]|nr:hypothetical protein B0H13DRAFT_1894215 [Mycena leptocephala]
MYTRARGSSTESLVSERIVKPLLCPNRPRTWSTLDPIFGNDQVKATNETTGTERNLRNAVEREPSAEEIPQWATESQPPQLSITPNPRYPSIQQTLYPTHPRLFILRHRPVKSSQIRLAGDKEPGTESIRNTMRRKAETMGQVWMWMESGENESSLGVGAGKIWEGGYEWKGRQRGDVFSRKSNLESPWVQAKVACASQNLVSQPLTPTHPSSSDTGLSNHLRPDLQKRDRARRRDKEPGSEGTRNDETTGSGWGGCGWRLRGARANHPWGVEAGRVRMERTAARRRKAYTSTPSQQSSRKHHPESSVDAQCARPSPSHSPPSSSGTTPRIRYKPRSSVPARISGRLHPTHTLVHQRKTPRPKKGEGRRACLPPIGIYHDDARTGYCPCRLIHPVRSLPRTSTPHPPTLIHIRRRREEKEEKARE